MRDDEWDDDEYPDEPEESGTITCPACRAEIYEDAEQCPLCGEYVVTRGSSAWQGKSPGYIALALLGIVAVVISLLFIR